jgi:hypothetical protein
VKKIILPIFSLTLLFLTTPVLADFNQALSNFRYRLAEYVTLHRDYETSKASYLQFKSLVAEKDAFEKTKKVLVARNKTLEAYFFLLQEKINQTQNIEKEDFDDVSKKLKSETEFLKGQRQRLEESQITSQLETLSKELEAKNKEFKDLKEEATSLAILGQLFSGFQSHQALQQKISNIIQERSQVIKDKALIERWMGESEKDAQDALIRRNEARQLLHQFSLESGYKKGQLLTDLKRQLKASKDLLERAVSAQEQVARRIS